MAGVMGLELEVCLADDDAGSGTADASSGGTLNALTGGRKARRRRSRAHRLWLMAATLVGFSLPRP